MKSKLVCLIVAVSLTSVALFAFVLSPALAVAGDHAGNWEVIVGHRHLKASAAALSARARAKGFTVAVESDARRDLEVEIDGFATQAVALAKCRAIRAAGLHCSLERS